MDDSSPNHAEPQGTASLLQHATAKTRRLCRVLGIPQRVDEIVGRMRELLGPNAYARRDAGPSWRSDVCDDHTPYEFSISFGTRAADIRVLMETLGVAPNGVANQSAGAAMTAQICTNLGLAPGRAHLIEDLFTSASPTGLFSRWHALEFPSGRPVMAKVYFNPLIHGPEHARATVEEALARLGLSDAWQHVAEHATRGEQDEVKYFSLDLGADATRPPRVKVYIRHHDATAADLEAYLRDAKGYTGGDATDLCSAILGSPGPYRTRPIFTCLSWVDGDARPAATVYAPVGAYVANDDVARVRISAYMERHGLPHAKYENALRAFASRPLDAGVGMQSYVSFKRGPGRSMTVYLSPEAYAVRPPQICASAAAE